MNGSDAFSETPPTKIPLEEIVRIVCFGISTDFPDFCLNKKCLYEKCPYFSLGFYKCYKKRKGVY